MTPDLVQSAPVRSYFVLQPARVPSRSRAMARRMPAPILPQVSRTLGHDRDDGRVREGRPDRRVGRGGDGYRPSGLDAVDGPEEADGSDILVAALPGDDRGEVPRGRRRATGGGGRQGRRRL